MRSGWQRPVGSLAVAVNNLLGALLYFVTGAIEGAGIGFLKRIPLVGKVFNPETYKKEYDATIAFFEAVREAVRNPSKIWQGIKDTASKAWSEVLDEYNKADEYNKSRIIAAGVVKVGLAVGGFIKELPNLLKGAVNVAKVVGKAAVTAGKIIAQLVRGVARIAGKLFKGIWKVIEGAAEEGKGALKYLFKKAGTDVFEEIPAIEATPFIKCTVCKTTPLAEAAEKELESGGSIERSRALERQYVDALKEQYPKLKDLDIRPKARPVATKSGGAPEFSFEERMQTTQGKYSYEVWDRGKRVLEIDGISVTVGWRKSRLRRRSERSRILWLSCAGRQISRKRMV